MGAVFVLMTLVISLAVMMLVLGTILDTYIYEFQTLGIPVVSDFYSTADSIIDIATSFYYLPTIFLLLFTVWLFKLIISRHRYTRLDEEEEW